MFFCNFLQYKLTTPLNNLTSFTVLTWQWVKSYGPILHISKDLVKTTGFATSYNIFFGGFELCTFSPDGTKTCFWSALTPCSCWYYVGFVYNYEKGNNQGNNSFYIAILLL